MNMPTGPKILVAGFTVWKDKQPYELTGSHADSDGNSCLKWKAPCYDCGAEFFCWTRGDEFKHVTRRCEACRSTSRCRPVVRNRYRHKLKQLRRRSGMTQVELGRASGMSDKRVSGYESRRVSLSDNAAAKLAEGLGVPVAEVWGEAG